MSDLEKKNLNKIKEKMTKNIGIGSLNIKDINSILKGLYALPYGEVKDTVFKIENSVNKAFKEEANKSKEDNNEKIT